MPTTNDENLAKDLIWSFFIAALNSFRSDTVLRPFPQKFINCNSNEKNIKLMQAVANQLPPISETTNENNFIDPETVELYKWVTSFSKTKLAYRHNLKFDEIKKLTKQEVPTAEPDYIFEVIYSDNHELRFQEYKKLYESVYAYHGSRLENFYSILRNGLVSHMCKNGAFGFGTYFSTELSVSLHYSCRGSGWSKSLLGDQLSCIAVCELIKDPSLKCGSKGVNQDSLSHVQRTKQMPSKYFLVCNNDYVQIRYILVYSFDSEPHKQNRSKWWRKNMFQLFMVSYFLILFLIGLSKWAASVHSYQAWKD